MGRIRSTEHVKAAVVDTTEEDGFMFNTLFCAGDGRSSLEASDSVSRAVAVAFVPGYVVNVFIYSGGGFNYLMLS